MHAQGLFGLHCEAANKVAGGCVCTHFMAQVAAAASIGRGCLLGVRSAVKALYVPYVMPMQAATSMHAMQAEYSHGLLSAADLAALQVLSELKCKHKRCAHLGAGVLLTAPRTTCSRDG